MVPWSGPTGIGGFSCPRLPLRGVMPGRPPSSVNPLPRSEGRDNPASGGGSVSRPLPPNACRLAGGSSAEIIWFNSSRLATNFFLVSQGAPGGQEVWLT